jgi:apolipoprotein N-acyltransferase
MTDGSPRRAWITRGLCLLAGAAAALAQPPWGLLPGLLGYAVLLRLLDRARGERPLRAAFLRGWLAGAGYFLVCVWWLGEPFQVDAANQGWMAPFAIALMAGGLALFWGAAALAYRALAGRSIARVLVFAGVFAAAEWLRGHLFTGFPWDLPGETWRAGGLVSQSASLVGAYGLTWITLAVAAAPAMIVERGGGPVAVGAALAVLLGLLAYGAQRIAADPVAPPTAPIVRIVQADVKQASKYDPAAFTSIVTRYASLTGKLAAPRPAIVVWPEGAIPAAIGDYLAPETWTREAVLTALAPGQVLLLGGYRVADGAVDPPVVFNSLIAVRRDADQLRLLGIYDKYRLVPFGEFIPLDTVAGRIGFKTLVHVGDGFSPGPPPRPMAAAGAPAFQPLICYEALYPGFTRAGWRASGVRASWIVNISNDAWFGFTSGPLQHLNMARYRAIEEGLPMARATPTGVSAMIDAFGRIRPGESLGQGAYGVIDARLPPALSPTLFSRLGDAPFFVMLLVSLAFVRPGSRRAA